MLFVYNINTEKTLKTTVKLAESNCNTRNCTAGDGQHEDAMENGVVTILYYITYVRSSRFCVFFLLFYRLRAFVYTCSCRRV